jgi:hypothetical protein
MSVENATMASQEADAHRSLQANTADPASPVRRCCPLEGGAAARPLRGWAI